MVYYFHGVLIFMWYYFPCGTDFHGVLFSWCTDFHVVLFSMWYWFSLGTNFCMAL